MRGRDAPPAPRSRAAALAREYLARGDATGWFEALYREAAGDPSRISWADLAPNPSLVRWVSDWGFCGAGKRALVVGSGLGDDAEYLAGLGCAVTAFDVSETAVGWCRRRFPDSRAAYRVADLFALPAEWRAGFDFVLEAYTLQVLPEPLRPRAMEALAQTLAPGATLLVITRGRDPAAPLPVMPWPMTKAEVGFFARLGLREIRLADFFDAETPPVRRLLAEYRRP